jgi:hypothetical protein
MNIRFAYPDFHRLTLMRSAASKDAARPVLCGVHVAATSKTAVQVTATNSYVIAQTTIPAIVEEKGAVLIDGKGLTVAAHTFKKVAPSKHRVSPADLAVTIAQTGPEAALATLLGPGDGMLCAMHLELTEGSLPNYGTVITRYLTEPAEVSAFKRSTKAEIVAYLEQLEARPPEGATKADLLAMVASRYQRVKEAAHGRASIAPARLSEAFGTLPDADFVTFQYRSEFEPLIIRSRSDREWLALVMPGRLR